MSEDARRIWRFLSLVLLYPRVRAGWELWHRGRMVKIMRHRRLRRELKWH